MDFFFFLDDFNESTKLIKNMRSNGQHFQNYFLCFYSSVVTNKLSLETWSEDSNRLGYFFDRLKGKKTKQNKNMLI